MLLFFRYQQHVPVTYKHVKNNEQFLEMVLVPVEVKS